MQRKFHGFPYISSALTTVPLILADSCFHTPRTRECSCPTTLQFLSLLDSNDMTSNIPYADLSPSNETICWLVVAWTRFRDDLAKQIAVLLALSEIVQRARTEVSPKVVWEGARTRFPHPRDVWWFFGGSWFDPTCMSLHPSIGPSQHVMLPSHNPARGAIYVITQVPYY